MHKFVRNVITEWRRLGLPFEGGAVVVGLSGGADSLSLLLALHDLTRQKKLKHRLIAAHFDHALRGGESDADAEFVRELCSNLDIECVVDRMNVPKRGNLEQFARNERYAFLQRAAAANGAVAVAVAHTLNDQAETFLINLIRGSGPDGLAAMPPVRPISGSSEDVILIRPLLRWARRQDTEDFCRERNADFRRDRMNDDPSFTRVRVRKEVVPLLQTFNPKIVDTLARTAELMGSANHTVKTAAEKMCSRNTLRVAELKELSRPEMLVVLRMWLGKKRGKLRSLEMKHIESIARLVESSGSGAIAEIPGGQRVIKHAGSIRFENIKVDK